MTSQPTTAARQAPLVCPGHTRPIADFNYSPITDDGIFLISASLDKMPMLRNGETGDWIGTFEGHKGAVWSAHLSRDATKAVTGSADFEAKVWNALSGDELQSLKHKHVVKTVGFSKKADLVLTGGNEKLLRIFDLNNPSEPLVMEGHEQPPRVAMFASDDDNTIISGGQDKKLRVWDRRTGKESRSFDVCDAITSMELSREGEGDWLVTTAGKEVQFWNKDTFDLVKVHQCSVQLNAASIRKDQKRFVAGGSDFWVRVFDFESGEEMECHKGHHGPVHCLRYSPDGQSYASGSEDGTIRLWNVDYSRLPGVGGADTAVKEETKE